MKNQIEILFKLCTNALVEGNMNMLNDAYELLRAAAQDGSVTPQEVSVFWLLFDNAAIAIEDAY